MRRLLIAAVALWISSLVAIAAQSSRQDRLGKPDKLPAPVSHADEYFKTSDNCLACHNGLTAASGEDVSIGADWRATIMANSSRDPYWQAAVRREVGEHRAAQADIEDECSVCHMPMARTTAHFTGGKGEVFAHLPVAADAGGDARFAHDGVSCTVCHQITSEKLGSPESFTGGYVIDASVKTLRPMYGPFEIDKGRTTIMRSTTDYRPTQSTHVQQSELCATCHTLYTTALDADGRPIGRLPEQMPYFEWRQSSFAATQSCQSCHMPAVENTAIASVLGEPRTLARHTFRGGNFFMLRMLNRYRADLGVTAPAVELDHAAAQTIHRLQTDTAGVAIDRLQLTGTELIADVRVQNQSGHKLPTGYPSRRVWLHLTVRDTTGRIVFESGGVRPDGSIDGADGDADGNRVEPHYTEITDRGQVQIYESVMVDSAGTPTTGLLHGVRYVKDNRLLPRGFDKRTAPADIAVVGSALTDDDFGGGEDRVRYRVNVGGASGPLQVEAELRFQPISYRWAQNLKPFDSSEAQRFVRYFDSMASASSEILARSTALASSSSH